MTSPIEPGVSEVGTEGTGEITPPGPNPAWNEVLELLPEQFHGLVTPHFKKWDDSAQGRIEELNSKVSSFEAYAPLIEHNISMEDVTQSLLLNQEINTNPRAIYDALVNAYGFSPQQAAAAVEDAQQQQQQQGQTPGNPASNPLEKQYQDLQQQMNLVSQIIINERESQAAKAEDARLDNALKTAYAKFPDIQFDDNAEKFILSQMRTESDAATAVQHFVDFRNSLAPAPFAPQIVGATGGGVPSNSIDPTKLNRQDTRSLVVQMLQAAKGQQT